MDNEGCGEWRGVGIVCHQNLLIFQHENVVQHCVRAEAAVQLTNTREAIGECEMSLLFSRPASSGHSTLLHSQERKEGPWQNKLNGEE